MARDTLPSVDTAVIPTTEPTLSEERKRTKTFVDLAARAGRPELVSAWVDSNASIEDAQREVISIIARDQPAPMAIPLERGRDQHTKFMDVATRSLLVRMGCDLPEAERRGVDEYKSLAQIEHECDRALGRRGEAFRSASIASGDFPNLLANALNKAVGFRFDQIPIKWPQLAKRSRTESFQDVVRVGTNALSTFQITEDGMPWPELATSDRKESDTPKSWGGSLSIGRQAISKDDTNELARVANDIAAAGRIVPDLVLFSR